jgi:hypothetical protein
MRLGATVAIEGRFSIDLILSRGAELQATPERSPKTSGENRDRKLLGT